MAEYSILHESLHLFIAQLHKPFLSSIFHRNIIIWSQDPLSSIWLPRTRMGDIGGDLGGCVGGNLLGFVGCALSPCRKAILSVGYGGSFHLWTRQDFATSETDLNVQTSTSRLENNSSGWNPLPFITGHFGAVTDLCWGQDGNFLLSVSKDQTCRVYARNILGEKRS